MKTRKLGRKIGHRRSLLKNLAASLILFEKVDTTAAKAKALRPVIERLISIAKKHDLSSYRRLLAYLPDKNAAKKIFDELSARYESRNSGFVRLYHMPARLGDNSAMMRIELVDRKVFVSEKKTTVKKTADEGTEVSKIDKKQLRSQKKLDNLTKTSEKSGVVTSVRTKAARKTGV